MIFIINDEIFITNEKNIWFIVYNYLLLHQNKYMKKTYDYEQNVKLKHNESLIKTNLDTGEMIEINKKVGNGFHKDKELVCPDEFFKKDFCRSWRFLRRELSAIEYRAAHFLAMKAKAYTNSLDPLNDDSTLAELMEELGVSTNRVKSVLQKLWDIGVYGKFEVKDVDVPYTKYWLLNPYLSFSGTLIKSDIANLFRNTRIAREYICGNN